MKKLIAILLTVVLSCALLVACGGGGAPAELTKETIVGKWEADMGALMGGGELMVEIEFTADGKYITSVDEDTFRDFATALYSSMGITTGLDTMIDAALASFESSAVSTYSFDGTTLVLAEETVWPSPTAKGS